MSITPLRRPWRPAPASETAAAWALMHEAGELSDANQRRFADWLAEDPTHIIAYENALWALDATALHAGDPAMLTLRAGALSARGRTTRWAWTGGIGMAAAASVAGVFLWTATPLRTSVGTTTEVTARATGPRSGNYQTGIGERSAIALPDGSVATLDTDSRIRVAYSDGQRTVHLLKGQALFEVAHGRPAPFRVYAAGRRITAVGTIFNVRINGSEVRVSMVEGAVRVSDAPSVATADGAVAPEITLTAGEGVVATGAAPLTVKPVESRTVGSWKGGLLVFNDVPLADAVAEINRYTTRPIAIADASIGAHRVSGVFKSNDPERFSQAMADVFPIDIMHAPDGAPTLRARSE